ncbi:hypothetical protein B7463_g3586, partial [Scytalidium lignicola]
MHSTFILNLAVIAVSVATVGAQNVIYSDRGSTIQYPVSINGIHLLSATAEDLTHALANNTITTLQLVDAYISRLEANDHQGLNLRSVIEIAPTARELARQLDAERSNGTLRSELHGVPIVVKDNYNTDPGLGMNTTAGSYSLLGQTVKGDAFVVSRLRAAGLLILGKANLDEFAGERGIKPNTSGWSPRGGQTQAAYVFGGFAAGGDPLGSSSGSAVSVSAGFAALSLGTDTEGSISGPSSRAALFGLRPSVGLTSRTGVVPVSSSQDTTGPMGKSTWDIAAALGIMAADDPEDEYSAAAIPFRHTNYTQFLKKDGFKGLRIGIPRNPFWNATFDTFTGFRSDLIPKMEASLVKMEAFGATIIDPIEFPDPDAYSYGFPGGANRTNNGTIRIQYDVRNDMAQYLQTQLVNSSLRTLEDVINENDKNAALEFPEGRCCQATFVAANELGDKATSAEYWLAKYAMDQLYINGIAATMRQHNLDLLLIAGTSGASRLGAIGRMPVGVVPVGLDDIGMPFGMMFVGKRFDEPTVLRAMYAYEKNFPPRALPPTLE